jgi:ABC-type uncharacterized transport system ATPase subunit
VSDQARWHVDIARPLETWMTVGKAMTAPLTESLGDATLAGSCIVQMRAIWKSFPGVLANRGIDLDLRVGEVHALLGENGAGKTTLMKILSGSYRADSGALLIAGRKASLRSPSEAFAAGVGMVHQQFRLVQKLTAAANIHLGWDDTPRLVSSGKLSARTREICSRFGVYVDPDAKVWQLSLGEQQRVEILRVLARGVRVLILDEPTAVLTPSETAALFQVMRSLAADGCALVFISHKLDEVLEVSDRITVLRQGRKVGEHLAAETDQRSLARLMVGQDVSPTPRHREPMGAETVLELMGAHALNDRGRPALDDVSLTIRTREIVGVAGVAGNGQTELAEVLVGLRRLQRGSIWLEGHEITGLSPRGFARLGVGHIPEDRGSTGLVLSASVADNAILREYLDPAVGGRFRLRSREVNRVAEEIVEEGSVQTASLHIPVGSLSGGNQQRLLARREIRLGSRVVIAVHPTRGLDIAATGAVRRSLLEHRNKGSGILLISEDLDEVLALSDRVVVMYENRVVGEFGAASAEREKVGLLMGGHVAES